MSIEFIYFINLSWPFVMMGILIWFFGWLYGRFLFWMDKTFN